MTQPSVLEWIIIAIVGLLVILYCIKSIYTIIDKKKNPQKYKDKHQKEQEKLDE